MLAVALFLFSAAADEGSGGISSTNKGVPTISPQQAFTLRIVIIHEIAVIARPIPALQWTTVGPFNAVVVGVGVGVVGVAAVAAVGVAAVPEPSQPRTLSVSSNTKANGGYSLGTLKSGHPKKWTWTTCRAALPRDNNRVRIITLLDSLDDNSCTWTLSSFCCGTQYGVAFTLLPSWHRVIIAMTGTF